MRSEFQNIFLVHKVNTHMYHSLLGYLRVNGRVLTWWHSPRHYSLDPGPGWLIITLYSVITAPSLRPIVCVQPNMLPGYSAPHWSDPGNPGLWLAGGSGIWIGIRVINLSNNAHTNNGPLTIHQPPVIAWSPLDFIKHRSEQSQEEQQQILNNITASAQHHFNNTQKKLTCCCCYFWSLKNEKCCGLLNVFPRPPLLDNLSILTNTPIVNFTPAKEKYWHQIYLRKGDEMLKSFIFLSDNHLIFCFHTLRCISAHRS